MTITRCKVLIHFFLGKRNGVTFKELFKYFFAKSYFHKANKWIEKIQEGSKTNSIYIKGIKKPLFYPKAMVADTLRQVIVESLYSNNWHFYEIPQTSVERNDVVVDCGTAEGLFSFLIAQRCKKIYMIEPLPDFVKCLKKTFAPFDNVEILQFAISDIETNAILSMNGIASSVVSQGEGIDVKVTTLDSLFFEKGISVSYLKIDVEGYDYLAIKGAVNLIKKYKPKIAVAVYHDFAHENQIRNFLKSIAPEYKFLSKGIYQNTGSPVILHAWI